ncbi:MAG: glutamate synthase [Kiritimatiellae bacterium]|nr:glutamate synthase [Kiritimatiellia bacterium]
MSDIPDTIIRARAALAGGGAYPAEKIRKTDDEGGCGVVGFAANVKVPGRHIFQPSIQMHNRGNGKGGGIAAAGLDAAYFGVTQEILENCYLLQIAFLDSGVTNELEREFILPFLDVAHSAAAPMMEDYRGLGLDTRPPDVRRYFVRVKPAALEKFSAGFPGLKPRQAEDEFIWQNSFKINRQFYAALGEKKAFVLSHARNLLILKIVGYAEQTAQYYRMENMPAHIWIAHQRFPTKGRVWHPGGAHPFIGMNEALVHNGDFANYYSVCEYLRQRNMEPQFLTDTEVAVQIFDLWSRVYQYPLEYVIEALAPTTELDFDRLPEDKRRLYGAIQAAHIHGSPDGPWFFIIASSHPDKPEYRLMGITDTSMLRPQVFAMSDDGKTQIGLCASEKQAIDAVLESLAKEDKRFHPAADKYWNARGGSHTDGGAFVFTLNGTGKQIRLACANKFGAPLTIKSGVAWDGSAPAADNGPAELRATALQLLEKQRAEELFEKTARETASGSFTALQNIIEVAASRGAAGTARAALDVLTSLHDRRYDLGRKKRSSVLEIIRNGIVRLLDGTPPIDHAAPSANGFRRITWETRNKLRAPVQGENALVVDARGFPPEGEECDAMLLVKAAETGWRQFIVYGLHGQRFHGCGFGPNSENIRVDLYGSPGDYAASGMDGCELFIHGDAQDQLAQILKNGKLVVYGNVGQTFMYGAKGGSVFVMGDAAGRPLINAVGRPRVVINGTCLDFLAESFMAGDPLNGGGFVIVNGIAFLDNGAWEPLALPYPGSNLFSLASGGALYIRDPRQTVIPPQLNGGHIVELSRADWALIKPVLEENERLFGVKVDKLLTVDGVRLPPARVYRKIAPIQASLLERDLADDDE